MGTHRNSERGEKERERIRERALHFYPYGQRDTGSQQMKRPNPKNNSIRDERTVYSSTMQSTSVGETMGARHARRKQPKDPDPKYGKSRANGRNLSENPH